MTEHVYLAFDLGASNGRAILGRFDGEKMLTEELHRFTTPVIESGDRLYWDLEPLWHELEKGFEMALETAPNLRSLSIDSWGVDYVPLGKSGEPLRNAYCYRDPRVLGMMEKATKRVSREKIYEATGIQFMEINTLYQVLADAELEPDAFEQTASRLMIADYFNARFCGVPVTEVSLASTTQLMDPWMRDWAVDLMDQFGIPAESWPRIVRSGTVLSERVRETPVAVIAGCSHDTACAVAATPMVDGEGVAAYLSCGTWSLLGTERTEPLINRKVMDAGFTNEAGVDGTIRLLKNLTGLWVLQECMREWNEAGITSDYKSLVDEATSAEVEGVIDLNDPRFSLRGDMVKKLHEYCDGSGLSTPGTRGQLVRLILESLAESHRRALRELEEVTGEKVDVLHIVGGGSRNDLLCQLTANACGCKVTAGPAEATALGNLLIQARTMGDLPDDRSIRDVVIRSTELKHFTPGTVPV